MDILVYFFELRPGSAFSYYIHLSVLAVTGIIAAIVTAHLIKKNSENRAMKKLFGKMPNKVKWLGILMIFLLATRYENIPYFSMRIWLYLTLFGLVYFVIKSSYLLVKKYPEERAFYHRNKKKKTEQSEKKVYSASKKRK